MVLDEVLKRFANESPVTIMARLTMQRALSPEWMDELFEAKREQQYTRERMRPTSTIGRRREGGVTGRATSWQPA